jgi:Nucleoside diphosphate kinase
MEKTLILIKPDGVKRSLIGEIIGRIEQKGLSIAELKMVALKREIAEAHYKEHQDKPFFGELVEFMVSGPVVALIVEGKNAIKAMRTMMGATNPLEAEVGTIRGDFALETSANLVHGSDSLESAQREIELFFPELK